MGEVKEKKETEFNPFVDKNLYEIDEFLVRNNQKLTQLKKLWAQGIGPRKTRIGARVFIAAEDEKAWLELMRNPTGKAAKIADYNKQMLREKSAHAIAALQARRGK